MRSSWLSAHVAALRALLVLTVLLGLAYPLAVLAVAQLPGLKARADGSLVHAAGSTAPVGSRLIGQSFTDSDGRPLVQYFQSRPSAAGDGYDPTATGASNLGPEDVIDTPSDGRRSLLSQVCARSVAVGQTERVDGSRPFCTAGGVGAVLAVFHADGPAGRATRVVSVNEACPARPFVSTWEGVDVQCASPGTDYSGGVVVPVRGDAPTHPVVPADAVTASGSGLDPAISPAYAQLQLARVAAARGVPVGVVEAAVARSTARPTLGFLGRPAVDVLTLNLDLDGFAPYRP